MTNDFNEFSESSVPILSPVELHEEGKTLLVCPTADEVEPWEPFALPPLRKSLIISLGMFTLSFWSTCRRCMGLLLMLDPDTRNWTWVCPYQRCGREAASWTTRNEDLPRLPGRRLLCGSFQTRLLAAGETVTDACPPVDGYHMVLQAGSVGDLRFMLRTQGAIQMAEDARVIHDEYAATVTRCMNRLRLI